MLLLKTVDQASRNKSARVGTADTSVRRHVATLVSWIDLISSKARLSCGIELLHLDGDELLNVGTENFCNFLLRIVLHSASLQLEQRQNEILCAEIFQKSRKEYIIEIHSGIRNKLKHRPH